MGTVKLGESFFGTVQAQAQGQGRNNELNSISTAISSQGGNAFHPYDSFSDSLRQCVQLEVLGHF